MHRTLRLSSLLENAWNLLMVYSVLAIVSILDGVACCGLVTLRKFFGLVYTCKLRYELQDILDVLPLKEISQLTNHYLKADDEFKQLAQNLAKPEFRTLLLAFTEHRNYSTIQSCIQLEKTLQALCSQLGQPDNLVTPTNGIVGYLDDLFVLLRNSRVKEVVRYKIRSTGFLVSLSRLLRKLKSLMSCVKSRRQLKEIATEGLDVRVSRIQEHIFVHLACMV